MVSTADQGMYIIFYRIFHLDKVISVKCEHFVTRVDILLRYITDLNYLE